MEKRPTFSEAQRMYLGFMGNGIWRRLMGKPFPHVPIGMKTGSEVEVLREKGQETREGDTFTFTFPDGSQLVIGEYRFEALPILLR